MPSTKPTSAVNAIAVQPLSISAIDFASAESVQGSLKKLNLKKEQIAPVMNEAFRDSAPKAAKLCQGIIARSATNAIKSDEARELILWGKGVGSDQRKVVCKSFNQAQKNVALVHGISQLAKNDARNFMKDYFASGNDMQSVARYLQIAGGVLRRHRKKAAGTDGDAVKVVTDAVEDAVDAATGAVTSLVDAVVSAGRSLASVVAEAVNWSLDEITDLTEALLEAGKTVVEILSAAATKGVSAIKSFAKALLKAGKSIGQLAQWIVNKASAWADAAVRAILEAGKTVADIMAAALREAAAVLTAVVKTLIRIGRKVSDILVNIVRSTPSIIRTVLEGLFAAGAQLAQVVKAVCENIAANFRRGFFEGLLAIGRGVIDILEAALTTSLAVLALAFAVFMEIWGGHRPLSSAERKEARRVFGWSIDLDRVKIAVASIPADVINWLNGQRPFTTMYIINFSSSADITMGTLIHELTHVWQAVVAGPIYMVQALHSQFFGKGYKLTDKDIEQAKGKLKNLEREQQAVLVERYWSTRWGAHPIDEWKKYEELAKQVYKAQGTELVYSVPIPSVIKVARPAPIMLVASGT